MGPTAKLEGPDIDLNVDAPSLDIDIEKPGKFDLSMPDVSLPKFGFKGKSPKVDMTCPDADIGMPEVDVKVATPAVGADIEIPDVNVNAKASSFDVDIEKPSADFDVSMPKLKMPNFGVTGKTLKADADFQISAPNL